MDETQRANRMLRQYLSIYAVDKRALIPIMKLPFIRRYSDLERGERTRELLKKSLRWGLIKASLIFVSLLLVTTVAAAMLSRREEWTGIRLSDGHTAAVRRAVFSPDGHLLVSVGEDKKVIVWDFARRERLATLADHTDWVTSVDFSSDGRWFATGSRDKTVIVWDAKRFEKIAVLREHQSPVNSVTFTPDGKFLASASESPDFRTVLWSVGNYQKVREFPCGSAYASLRFSPNGRWLLPVGPSCTSTWDVATGERLQTAGDQSGGNWSSLSPDGTRQVSIGTGGDVVFVDMREYWTKTKPRVLSIQQAHQDNGRAVSYSPDGRLVATGADYIVLWDATTQSKLARLEHTAIVWSLAFSPDGRWLVSTHGDGAILVWDVVERALAANFNEHAAPVRSVAFSSDGKRIASGSEDRSVIIWDTEHDREEAVLLGHTSRIVGIAFSRNEEILASSDLRGNIILWDTLRRQPRLTFKSGSGDSYGLAISPDGRWLANSHGIFEAEKGHQVVDFISGIKDTRGGAYGVAFSQDGRWLVCVTECGQIFLWDDKSWQLLDRLELPGAQLITVSFSPDGKWIVTGEDEGAIRLWSVSPLREAAIIGHHSARVKSVAFSPDGKQIASAGDDQTIALWDVQRRSLITDIGTHSAPVLSVAFSLDGKRLVSGEHDKSVRLYTRHRSIWSYKLD